MHSFKKYFTLPVIGVTVLVLVGWIFDVVVLKRILPGFIAMNPITAICLMLLATGVFVLEKHPLSAIFLKIIAAIILILMLFILSDSILLTQFDLDQTLFIDDLNGNKIAIPTISNLILMSLALLFYGNSKTQAWTSQVLTLWCLAFSLIFLSAYLLNLGSIISESDGAPMALHTSLCFISLSIASLHIKPDAGFMKDLTSNSLGGILTRKALPIMVFVPFLLGYLRLSGERNNLYSTEFGIALLVVSIAMVSGILMWYYAKNLNIIHNRFIETVQNLKLSEWKFSMAFNHSGIGMALVSPAGDWLEVNDALCDMLGYTKEEMRKLSFQNITHQEDLDLNVFTKEEMLKGKVNSYQTEKRYLHKNGSTVSVLVSSSLVRELDNTPKFFVTQVLDISSSKKLLEELNSKNEILTVTTEDLEVKMKQLEEFNKIVAHNLRGPAGSIHTMIGMVAETQVAEERSEMLGLLQESSQSLNDTLNTLIGILEVRLNKSITFDTCNFEQITVHVSTMLKGDIIVKKAQIETDFEIKEMQYPRVYLESIFYNMISNSLKYSATVSTPVIHISSRMINERVMLSFKDNGLGIDLNKHGHNLFKLNKVFHSGFDSKGIGLFMTKNHIETFGGTIEVSSEPGKGSEFIILI